jgi:hypothetical protein
VPVTIQAVLGRFEGLLADEGRHRHGHPLLRWGRLLTLTGAHWRQGGLALAGRRGAGPATVGDSWGGRRAQHAPYRGDIPAFSASGRGHLGLTEALGPVRQTGRLSGGGIPGNHVRHHGRVDWGKAHAAGSPRTVGIEERAVGCAGPGQQLATAELRLPPPSQALGNQGPLVLGHRRADVSPQLSMRISTHRPLDTRNATATLGACIAHEHLMDIVARSTIRGGAQHTGQGGHGSAIAESIKTGALEAERHDSRHHGRGARRRPTKRGTSPRHHGDDCVAVQSSGAVVDASLQPVRRERLLWDAS